MLLDDRAREVPSGGVEGDRLLCGASRPGDVVISGSAQVRGAIVFEGDVGNYQGKGDGGTGTDSLDGDGHAFCEGRLTRITQVKETYRTGNVTLTVH